MGTIRAILALAVVVAHIHGVDEHARVGGSGAAVMAVKLFYLFSGFYMAFVLSEKYAGRPLAFYRARIIRLYPLYWVTLALSLLFLVSANGYSWLLDSISDVDVTKWIVSFVANLTFVGLDSGHLFCSIDPDGRLCAALRKMVVVPQAWTLGIEILFYLIAPLLAFLGLRAIAGVFLVSLATKAVIIAMGLGATVWGRNLALAELVYFMLGMVAFTLYQRIKTSLPEPRHILIIVLPLAVILIVTYEHFFVAYYVEQHLWLDIVVDPLFFAAFTFLVPLLFHATRHLKWDNWIGDWSYPIYITHFFALGLSSLLLQSLVINSAWARFSIHMAFVLVFAGIALFSVVWPIERLRAPRRVGVRQ